MPLNLSESKRTISSQKPKTPLEIAEAGNVAGIISIARIFGLFDQLWKIDWEGKASEEFKADNGDWSGAMCMTSSSTLIAPCSLWMPTKQGNLWQVDVNNPDATKNCISRSTGWEKARFLASWGQYLLIITDKLYKYDTMTNTSAEFLADNGNWINTSAIAIMGDFLFVTCTTDGFYRVDLNDSNPNTNCQCLSGGWANTKAMAAANGHIYIFNNQLFQYDTTKNTFAEFKADDGVWKTAKTATAIGGMIYVIVAQDNKGDLYRVDVNNSDSTQNCKKIGEDWGACRSLSWI